MTEGTTPSASPDAALELASELRRGKLFVVVGPEVGADLDRALAEHLRQAQKLRAREPLEKVARRVEREGGPERLRDLAGEFFAHRDLAPTREHRLLAKLRPTSVLSFQVDPRLEVALKHENITPLVMRPGVSRRSPRPDETLVIKPFGDVAEPSSLRLTTLSRSSTLGEHPWLVDMIRQAMRQRPLLLLGVPGDEDDLPLSVLLGDEVRGHLARTGDWMYRLLERMPGVAGPDDQSRIFPVGAEQGLASFLDLANSDRTPATGGGLTGRRSRDQLRAAWRQATGESPVSGLVHRADGPETSNETV